MQDGPFATSLLVLLALIFFKFHQNYLVFKISIYIFSLYY